MKIEDLFLVLGIGWLDWAKIGRKGRYSNIGRSIYVIRKNRLKTNGQSYKTTQKRLTNLMTIKLGVNLLEPLHMPYLVNELFMINEKNKKSCARTLRISADGQTITHFYGRIYKTAFKPYLVDFFLLLKEILGATDMNCSINCNNPGYVEITATIENREFNFPARFPINLVHVLNSREKGGGTL